MRPTFLSALLALTMALGRTTHAAAQGATVSPRAARIQSDLRQILSDPEYAVKPPGETIAQRVGRWISEQWTAFKDWLDRIFSFGGRAGPGTARFMMWVVLAALIIGIAYVLAYAIRRGKWGKGSRGQRRPERTVSTDALEERVEDPDSLLAVARELAASGQFHRAYRAIFLAILLRMDKVELIRFDRSRTNGEYLRSLRAHPDVLAWMRPLANDFDFRWYGGHPVDEPDYRRALSLYERFTAELQKS